MRVLRRARRPAAGRPGEDPGRAQPGGHQRPARPLPRRRPVHYQLNGGITGPSTSFVNYGTIVDFVPIVLGNGRIRLDVRPEVSEIDQSLTVVGGHPVVEDPQGRDGRGDEGRPDPGDCRVGAEHRGRAEHRPAVDQRSPLLGAPFRNVNEQINEVETLIMVTPELVEALDANQVPPCGPGMETTSPSDWELFFKGHLEVPVCCPTGVVRAACSAVPPTAGRAPRPHG